MLAVAKRFAVVNVAEENCWYAVLAEGDLAKGWVVVGLFFYVYNIMVIFV